MCVRGGEDGGKREVLGSQERVAVQNGQGGWEEVAGDQSKRLQSRGRGTGCELLGWSKRKKRELKSIESMRTEKKEAHSKVQVRN